MRVLAGLSLLVLMLVGPVGSSSAAEDLPCAGIGPTTEVTSTDLDSQPLVEMGIARAHEIAAARGVEPGEGVVVAVIDSGVGSAAALDVVDRVSLTGAVPEDFHGTAVAGLIAGQPRPDGGAVGVAPAAQILDLQVYADPSTVSGDGLLINPDDVVAALTEVLRRVRAGMNIRVVNISLSLPDDDRMEPLVEQLWDAGVVVVAPTGNRPSTDAAPNPLLAEFEEHRAGEDAATFVHPASHLRVLAVNSSMTGLPASVPATTYVLENSRTDLAAPTAGAVSYAVNGSSCLLPEPATSWAAAEVSGVLALMQSVYDESPGRAVSRLLNTADGRTDIPTRLVGAGEVQPVAALTRNLPMDEAGTVSRTVVTDQPQRATAPPEEPDLLAATRRHAAWWGVIGGGALLLALVLRPVLARRVSRR